MIDRTSDTLEEELNAIRLSIYEEIKDMTPEEEENYFRTQTEPIIKEFNMKRSTLKPVKPIPSRREEVLIE